MMATLKQFLKMFAPASPCQPAPADELAGFSNDDLSRAALRMVNYLPRTHESWCGALGAVGAVALVLPFAVIGTGVGISIIEGARQ